MKVSWQIALLALLTFLVFSPALKFGFTNWDDQVYVYENQLIQDLSPSGVKKIMNTPVAANYHPLTMFSLAINYKFSEYNPFSYHLTNVLLHILNSILVFLLIYSITNKKADIALITGILFAIHPMHVESVAWVAARKDVLYSFFFLLALITYRKYVNSKKILWYLITCLLFILSLASKPAAVVFPLVLFAIDHYLGRKIDRKTILEKLPLLLLSLVAGLLTISAQDAAGALGDTPVFSFPQKILFASHSLLVYIVKSLIPANLSAFHPYPFIKDLSIQYYLAPFLVLAIAGGLYYYFRKNKSIVFGSLFFILNIAIVLQLFSFGNAIMAERYTYLPYIGLFFIIGTGFSHISSNKEKKIAKWKNGALALLLLFSGTLSYASYKRNNVWKNSDTLWSNVVEVYPLQSTGWYNLGHYLSEQKLYDRSIPAFTKAIEIRENYYEAYYNRAQAYRLTGKNSEAISDYTRAIQIKPSEPNPYMNRGTSYFNTNEFDKALSDFEKAVQLAPGDFNTWFGRGNAHFYSKEFTKAVNDYNKTIELNPNFADGFYNRSIAYGNLGDKKKSLADLLESEKLGKPRDQKMMDWLTGQN